MTIEGQIAELITVIKDVDARISNLGSCGSNSSGKLKCMLLGYAMTEEEFNANNPKDPVFKVVSVKIDGPIRVKRVQTNMFFYPSDLLEDMIKVRHVADPKKIPEGDSPDGLIHFHQIHVHKGLSRGLEFHVSYTDQLVESGEYLTMQTNGLSDSKQAYAWLAYVWYEDVTVITPPPAKES